MSDVLSISELVAHIQPKLVDLPSTQARRLLHGRGACFAGWQHLSIDFYAGVVLLTWFAEPTSEQALQDALLAAFNQQAVTLLTGMASQHRHIKPATTHVLWGEVPDKLVATEGEMQFWVDMKRQNSGLFMDMAPGRQWLLENAAGKQLLNTFAFTCSLSIAAIAGGAQRVVNIDMNGGVLKRGRENQALNGQQSAAVEYLPYKVLNSIGKLERKGPFDLLIADPPTFQRGSFEFDKDYARLLRRLPRLLAADATLLLCCNSPRVSMDEFRSLIADNLPAAEFVERLPSNEDYVERAEAPLKVLRYRYAVALAE
ncbi:MAG TPA: methyltransferase [Oceanospirillaceae bacterium]|nr:methyltransferase [Oceanospirillaceae bacterium]